MSASRSLEIGRSEGRNETPFSEFDSGACLLLHNIYFCDSVCLIDVVFCIPSMCMSASRSLEIGRSEGRNETPLSEFDSGPCLLLHNIYFCDSVCLIDVVFCIPSMACPHLGVWRSGGPRAGTRPHSVSLILVPVCCCIIYISVTVYV